jgi:hypothetical protein
MPRLWQENTGELPNGGSKKGIMVRPLIPYEELKKVGFSYSEISLLVMKPSPQTILDNPQTKKDLSEVPEDNLS